VSTRCSLLGANATALTAPSCASIWELGLLEFSLRVSQLGVSAAIRSTKQHFTHSMSILSSPTEANM
jgi:hypothetical protein